MSRRSERLASAGADRGADVPAASRADFPAGTRRCREVPRGRRHDFRRAGSRRGGRRDRCRVDDLMSKLAISAMGPASSVQDGGRYGAQRYGLTPSGAMDRLALAAANSLVGNATFAAAIEIGPFSAAVNADQGAGRITLGGGLARPAICGPAPSHK